MTGFAEPSLTIIAPAPDTSWPPALDALTAGLSGENVGTVDLHRINVELKYGAT
jgi:hypothetical protein